MLLLTQVAIAFFVSKIWLQRRHDNEVTMAREKMCYNFYTKLGRAAARMNT